MRERKGYPCARCGKEYGSRAQATLCGRLGAPAARLRPGDVVRSLFFYRDFPDGTEEENRFELLDAPSRLVPSVTDGTHRRMVAVAALRMRSGGCTERHLFEDELMPVGGDR